MFEHEFAGVNETLECIREENDTVSYTRNSSTDAKGCYSIPVRGDHEEEICVVVANPPRKGQCRQAMPNKSDRIILTKNMGAATQTRYFNPLGFMTQTTNLQCTDVVQELGLDRLHDD
ncbi:olee1-like protein [Vigna unguiculata]|uniref:Pollen allergen Ole e 1 family n=1 Tax=Vigna unguiculata TaxID=3917 RepID=A0A4D6N8A1_VIGUN|nr:olee1-like protein [Vigna unguiculata]QCE10063.1 Pollen allergen Ole e 1 family [Vigna unguiculata]